MKADLYTFTNDEKRTISKAINKALYYSITDFKEEEIDYLNKLERHFKFEVEK